MYQIECLYEISGVHMCSERGHRMFEGSFDSYELAPNYLVSLTKEYSTLFHHTKTLHFYHYINELI